MCGESVLELEFDVIVDRKGYRSVVLLCAVDGGEYLLFFEPLNLILNENKNSHD